MISRTIKLFVIARVSPAEITAMTRDELDFWCGIIDGNKEAFIRRTLTF